MNVCVTRDSISFGIRQHSCFRMQFSRDAIRISLKRGNERMKSVAWKWGFEVRQSELASHLRLRDGIRFGRLLPEGIRFRISRENVRSNLEGLGTRIDGVRVDDAASGRDAPDDVLREDGTTADDAHLVVHAEGHFLVSLIRGESGG